MEMLDSQSSGQPHISRPVFEEADSTESDGGSSGGTGQSTRNPSVVLTMNVDAETIDRYLNTDYVTDVTVIPGSGSNHLDIDWDVSVPAGKMLTLDSGVTTRVVSGKTLQIWGRGVAINHLNLFHQQKPSQQIQLPGR